jgi:NAD(P)-dependent dehydrogenase (short-subunit alcohol dehydrogenase family)
MKNIFITGISSGIGKNAAQYLVDKGFTVHGSVRNTASANAVKQEIKKNLFVYIFDVTDDEGIRAALGDVKSNLGDKSLDVLINNAGIAVPGPLFELSDEKFTNQMNVNVFAVRKVTNALLPLLGYGDTTKKNPGKIINISSVSGLFNTPFNGAYCISKHALESMTDIYRRELIPFGIDVIAIEPGPIKSKIWDKNLGAMQAYYGGSYGELLKKADTMIENAKTSALPTEVVSKKIFEIINNKSPKTRYIIHKKRFLFKLMTKFLPDRITDRLIWKNFKQNTYRPV